MGGLIGRFLFGLVQAIFIVVFWEWLGVIGLIASVIVWGILTTQVIVPWMWKVSVKLGADPQERYDKAVEQVKKRANDL